MKELFLFVAALSLNAAVVAIAVMLVRLLLQKAPRIFSYALWAVVLFRLLCPVSIPALIPGFSFQAVEPSAPVLPSQSALISDTVQSDVSENQLSASHSSAGHPSVALENDSVLIDAETVFTYIWIGGAGMLAAYALFSYFRLKYRLRFAVCLERGIYESDRLGSAFVLGFVRPKIYLPAGLSAAERECMIKHEKTHIRRGDFLIKPLAFFAVCLHWFNPVIWLAYDLAMRDMEISCDESVIRKLDPQMRKSYSFALLSAAQKRSGLITPLAFSETSVKTRIRKILRFKKPAVWISITAAVAIVVAAALLIPGTIGSREKDLLADLSEQQAGEQKAMFFDLAREYRFDYVPQFEENKPPQSSSAYLTYTFVLDPILDDNQAFKISRFKISREDVDRVASRHYDMDAIQHEGLTGIWEYTDGEYSAVPFACFEEPLYAAETMTVRRQNGKEIYTVTASRLTFSKYKLDDSDYTDVRNAIVTNDYAQVLDNGISVVQKERFSFYLNDNAPVFLSHTELSDQTNVLSSYIADIQQKHQEKEQEKENNKRFTHVYAKQSSESGLYSIYDNTTDEVVVSEKFIDVDCQLHPDDTYAPYITVRDTNGHWGMLDAYGNEILSCGQYELDAIQLQTHEGVWPIVVVQKDGLYGAIDYQGNMVIQPEWETVTMDVYNIGENFVYVKDPQGNWHVMEIDGTPKVVSVKEIAQPPEGIN